MYRRSLKNSDKYRYQKFTFYTPSSPAFTHTAAGLRTKSTPPIYRAQTRTLACVTCSRRGRPCTLLLPPHTPSSTLSSFTATPGTTRRRQVSTDRWDLTTGASSDPPTPDRKFAMELDFCRSLTDPNWASVRSQTLSSDPATLVQVPLMSGESPPPPPDDVSSAKKTLRLDSVLETLWGGSSCAARRRIGVVIGLWSGS